MMDQECETHLEDLKKEVCARLDVKYRHGVEVHGGRLWEKGFLLDEAIFNAIDVLVFLLTLRRQKKDLFKIIDHSKEERELLESMAEEPHQEE